MSHRNPHNVHQDYLEGFANAWASQPEKKSEALPIKVLKFGVAATGGVAILVGFGLMMLAMPKHR